MSYPRAKYNNRKTVIDGITFDSAKEARRYGELKLLQRAGEISNLNLQSEYELTVNWQKICKYRADFEYTTKDGRKVVEDVKGVRTPVYQLKKKLMKAVYNIEIKEI